MITIFVKYTVNLHPICLRICFTKRQNCSTPRASKMQQFSGGGPPNPRFLPKLSMTVKVNHKKLYYNYYTLGKYLLKIQISSKILRPPHPLPQLQMLCYVPVDQGWVDYKIFVVRYYYSYFKNM